MLRGELFATDMVRAYQEGRKLHTARPMKLQVMPFADGTVKPFESAEDSGDGFAMMRYRNFRTSAKAKHRPGDYIYCRETWTAMRNMETGHVDYFFAAIQKDYDTISSTYLCDDDGFDTGKPFPWKPSIHMPKSIARLFFRNKNTTVMRLEDVDEQFALEDGFTDHDGKSALEWFRIFWRATYGPDARWMWVYWTEPCSREEAMRGDD